MDNRRDAALQDKPHIVFLNEFFHPDICASAVVMTDHLTKLAAMRPDWRITAITGNRAWNNPSTVYADEEQFQSVQILRVKRPAIRRKSLLWRGLGFAAFHRVVLKRAAVLEHVDLVVGTTAPPQGGMLAARIAREKGCPFIYKVFDLYPDAAVTLGRLREGGWIHCRWLKFDTEAMRRAAAVVTISTPITDRISKTRGIAADRLHTIHDGFDPASITFQGKNTFSEEHNPNGAFVVQYAGNMGLSHPFETILDAAKLLAGQKDVLFQFIGDGPQRGELRYRLPSNAKLIDYQPAERLGQILDAADVCLISQHSAMFDQAMPYKIYAILAAGKPVIFVGNAKSEVVQWLVDLKAGKVVAQGDAARLSNVILEMRNATTSAADGTRRLNPELPARLWSLEAARRWMALLQLMLNRS